MFTVAEPTNIHIDLIQEIDNQFQESWDLARTDPKKSEEIANSALLKAKEIGYKKGEAYLLCALGAALVWSSRTTEAHTTLLEAQEKLELLGEHELLVEAIYLIAVVFIYQGDYSQHLHHCKEAYDIAQSYQDLHGMATALNGIGTSYLSIGKHEQSLKYLNECLEICEKTDNQLVFPRVWDALAQVYLDLNDFEKSIYFRKKSLDLASDRNDLLVKSYCFQGLADTYVKMDKPDEAKQFYEKCLNLRRKIKFKAGEALTLLHLGDLLAGQNKTEQAKELYEASLDISHEYKVQNVEFKAHLELSKLYEAKNDLPNFAVHYKAYHRLHSAYYLDKIQQNVKSNEIEHKKERKAYFKGLDTLSEIGSDLTSSLDITKIFDTIYEKLNRLMDAYVLIIFLYDKEKRTLTTTYAIENGLPIPQAIINVDEELDTLATWTIRNREMVIINDHESEYQNYLEEKRELRYGDQPESIIYAPLEYRDQLIGAITVQSLNKHAYTEEHISIFKNLSVFASIGVNNALYLGNLESELQENTKFVSEQNERLEQRINDTKVINLIGQQLISNLDLDDVFLALHENVQKMMDANCFGIRIYDKEREIVNYKYDFEDDERQEEIEVPMSQKNNYSVWCIENKQPILINDNMAEYSRYVDEIHVVDGDMPHSLLFQPLIHNDEVLGVVSVQSSKKNAYTEYHLEILQTLASYTVIALNNARSYEEMENKVKERTVQIKKQRDIIQMNVSEMSHKQRNTNMLNELGKKITSQLEVNNIIKLVYRELGTIMEVHSMGIGIHNEDKGVLTFPGLMENDEVIEGVEFDLNEEGRLASICFNEQKEILIGDYNKDILSFTSQNKSAKAGKLPNSLMYLPLTIEDNQIGVISVQSFNQYAYNNYHISLLRHVANYTCIAIQNARLYYDSEKLVKSRTKDLIEHQTNTKLINQLGQKLIASFELEPVVEEVSKNINSLMKADILSIRLIDKTSNEVVYKYGYNKGEKMPETRVSMDNKNNYSVWCIQNKKSIFINHNTLEFGKYVDEIHVVRGHLPESLMFHPMMSNDEIFGVITVQCYQKNAYTSYHLDLLETLANYVLIAVNNAQKVELLEKKIVD